jgi:hypothetical protein
MHRKLQKDWNSEILINSGTVQIQHGNTHTLSLSLSIKKHPSVKILEVKIGSKASKSKDLDTLIDEDEFDNTLEFKDNNSRKNFF